VSVALLAFLPSGLPHWTSWLCAAFVVFATGLIEYALHRWPMHRRRRLTSEFFRQHTLIHHRVFTYEAMGVDSFDEISLVIPNIPLLVSSVLILAAVVGAFTGLVSLEAGLLSGASLNLAAAFKHSIHCSFHFPDSWMKLPVFRSRVFQAMKEHHAIHHDPRMMTRWNFNIGVPLYDKLFGTLTWERR
jgi:hypothetical protein